MVVVSMTFDLRKYPKCIEAINAVLNNGGVAEVKLEHNGRDLLVLEVNNYRIIKAKIETT